MTRKKKNNLTLWIMLAAIVVVVAAIFLLPSCGGNSDTGKATLVKVGQEAPDFTVDMSDGTQVTLSHLRGRVVLLNFWATWCPPCRAELKRVPADLLGRFADQDFTFLPVSRGEERITVTDFLSQHDYTFPAGLDPQEQVYGLYASNFIPRNFLIGKDGRIVKITVGYTPEEFDELIRAIETQLLKQ